MNSSDRYLFNVLLTAALLPLATRGQDVQVMYVERGQQVYQDSATTTIPISQQWPMNGPSNWSTGAGLETGSGPGTISNLKIFTPKYPSGVGIPWTEDDGWEIWEGFSNRQEMEAEAPAGTYTFTGTGSAVGAFSESIVLGAHVPQVVKKFTNWAQLQAFDPNEDLVIEWEPFTDKGDIMAFIDIEVSYWNGMYDVYLWDSSEDPRAVDFGLPPEITSVTIPAGRISGSPYNTYRLQSNFIRVDVMGTPAKFPEALIAGVTGLDVDTEIHADTGAPGRLWLPVGNWLYVEPLGVGIYGYSPDWGFIPHVGMVNVRLTPGWIFQRNLGWICPVAGSAESGLWFYSENNNWLYCPPFAHGLYYSFSQHSWNNMIRPGT